MTLLLFCCCPIYSFRICQCSHPPQDRKIAAILACSGRIPSGSPSRQRTCPGARIGAARPYSDKKFVKLRNYHHSSGQPGPIRANVTPPVTPPRRTCAAPAARTSRPVERPVTRERHPVPRHGQPTSCRWSGLNAATDPRRATPGGSAHRGVPRSPPERRPLGGHLPGKKGDGDAAGGTAPGDRRDAGEPLHPPRYCGAVLSPVAGAPLTHGPSSTETYVKKRGWGWGEPSSRPGQR